MLVMVTLCFMEMEISKLADNELKTVFLLIDHISVSLYYKTSIGLVEFQNQ